VPHAAQQAMSSESTPTLSGTVPTFERLIEGWNHIANHFPHFAPLISIGLLWADKYDDQMGTTNAYAVSMYQFCIFFNGSLTLIVTFSH
ncbi:hypothetical protein BDR03DRAFT_858344, partial [Suillus americanus]